MEVDNTLTFKQCMKVIQNMNNISGKLYAESCDKE